MFKKQLFFIPSLLLFFMFLHACKMPDNKAENKSIKVVCTTGMLGDALKNILKDNAEVISLMGPGVDPHLYKATQGDLKALTAADIIVYNGLHLEGKMGEIFEKLKKTKIVIAAGEGIPATDLIQSSEFQGNYDPHLWFDVSLWSKAISYITKELNKSSLFDSTSLNNNLNHYKIQLDSLNKATYKQIASIDEQQRVLITAHDAFSYFGRAYDIEVKGLQGISTLSEYGLKDISEMVNYINTNKIKAVFVESSVSDRSLNAVLEGCKSSGHLIKIGGTLYSDAMGAEGSPEGNYIGMVDYNVKTIVDALK